MIVKGWNNGKPNDRSGAGYGIILSKSDRDVHFKQSWDSITIDLEGIESVQVKLSESFWKDCTELRSSKIGKWLLRKELAPWKKNYPPTLSLESLRGKKFLLTYKLNYEDEYSEEYFWEKLSNNALKAGREIVLNALTLYYCLLDEDTPYKSKAIIIGALGYFIVPLDAIPDFTPLVGYGDDLGAIMLALGAVAVHIKPEHRIQAEKQFKIIFGKNESS